MPAHRNHRERPGTPKKAPHHRSSSLTAEPSTSHCLPTLGQNELADPPLLEESVSARPPPLTLRDMNCVRMLGKGAYGQVILCRVARPKNTLHPLDYQGSLFALKAMEKNFIRPEQTADADERNAERECLTDLAWSPFVASLISPFSDPRNLYLALELAPCGTLRHLIHNYAPFSPSMAAFYFSNIICGLEALELYNIVHCDLKPDNILIGIDGYVSLADFGQSKFITEERGWIANGTPCYMAPELLYPKPQEHFGHVIDWWASGCILFEMLTKCFAFRGKTDAIVNHKVITGDYEWPPGIRPGRRVRDIVEKLLNIESLERLGYEGSSEVMQHPWLSKIGWQKMKDRWYTAPYKPQFPNLSDSVGDLPDPNELPGIFGVDCPA